MAMQSKAWMTVHLFKAWIGHFIKNVRECGLEMSPSCCHLLILDGHGSHVTMDVAKTARAVGLDFLTLFSRTSHAIQPLDVLCFKPFKQAFRLLWDVWTLCNKSRGASALTNALTQKNITSGFRTIGIYSFNPHAMHDKMGPSEFYREVPMTTATCMPEGEAMDLGALENLQGIRGTFMAESKSMLRGGSRRQSQQELAGGFRQPCLRLQPRSGASELQGP
jgi:hypothetical protein